MIGRINKIEVRPERSKKSAVPQKAEGIRLSV